MLEGSLSTNKTVEKSHSDEAKDINQNPFAPMGKAKEQHSSYRADRDVPPPSKDLQEVRQCADKQHRGKVQLPHDELEYPFLGKSP